MFRCACVVFSLVVWMLSGGCGSVPPTYYYRIQYDIQDRRSADNTLPVTLGIQPFTADVAYQDERIVYRESRYEVRFYHYRRWVAPPRKLVTQSVLKQFEASGRFDEVVRLPAFSQADYVLSGEIRAFEELDAEDGWYGLVTIAFTLTDRQTSEVVWEEEITQRTPAAAKEPLAVVEAISKSLQSVVEQAIEAIHQTLLAMVPR